MIRFENVTKRFGTKTVLDDISYEIKKGETFNNGIVNDPTKIMKVWVAADVK